MDNVTCVERSQSEYTFLARYRYTEDNCTLLGGRYYAADDNHLGPDCVFDWPPSLTGCSSWEVHGMGHSEDLPSEPRRTYIPFVNFSVITDPCLDDWFGVTCESHTTDGALPGAVPNMTVTQMWLYSNNLQGEVRISTPSQESRMCRASECSTLASPGPHSLAPFLFLSV